MAIVFRIFEHQLTGLRVKRVHPQVKNTPEKEISDLLKMKTQPPIICVFHFPEKLVLGPFEGVRVVHNCGRDQWVSQNLVNFVATLLIVAWIDVDKYDLGMPKPNIVLSPKDVETVVLLDMFERESGVEPGRLHVQNYPQRLSHLVHLSLNSRLRIWDILVTSKKLRMMMETLTVRKLPLVEERVTLVSCLRI